MSMERKKAGGVMVGCWGGGYLIEFWFLKSEVVWNAIDLLSHCVKTEKSYNTKYVFNPTGNLLTSIYQTCIERRRKRHRIKNILLNTKISCSTLDCSIRATRACVCADKKVVTRVIWMAGVRGQWCFNLDFLDAFGNVVEMLNTFLFTNNSTSIHNIDRVSNCANSDLDD